MRRTAKVLILLLVFVALPLRGYAAAVKNFCDAHHGGLQGAHHAAHEHADPHDHSKGDGKDQAGAASLCGLCSVCSVGAPLLSESPRLAAHIAAAAPRIPFLEHFERGVSLDHPDRPPLAS